MQKGGFIYNSDSDQALIAFVVSLGFHGLFFLLFTLISDGQPVSNQDIPLEIVFNQPNPKDVEFIQTQKLKDSKKPKDKKEVRFKSDRTQRTELETFARPNRSAEIHANMNSGGQGGKSKKQETKKEVAVDEGAFKVDDSREELILPGFGSTSAPPMIPTYVQQRLPPGVRLGNITALNTDQHRFYSFNQRLLTRFVPLWGERVRSALYQWIDENQAPAISKKWVTNVEVIMNKKGEILDVQPFRLSGLWSIDEASINSFKQVKNVPNPPSEMVDENGYIHLQFQTEVLWVPQPGVRFHGGN